MCKINGTLTYVFFQEGSFDEEFDYAVVAVGQYSDRKRTLQVDGQENFKGRIITEVDIESLSELSDKEVVVVGFGKSALDMTVYVVIVLRSSPFFLFFHTSVLFSEMNLHKLNLPRKVKSTHGAIIVMALR